MKGAVKKKPVKMKQWTELLILWGAQVGQHTCTQRPQGGDSRRHKVSVCAQSERPTSAKNEKRLEFFQINF